MAGGLLEVDVAQPLSRSSPHSRNLRRLPASNPKSIVGHARARAIPVADGLIVIVVLSGPLPERVAGAKAQPQPLGRPLQAKVSDALNPFCGATEIVMDPEPPCAMLSVLLESESA